MTYSITLGGKEVQWKLEYNPRLKKMHILVHPQEGIIVRVPPGHKASGIDSALMSQSEWLLTRMADISRRCPFRTYTDGQRLPYLGEEVILRLHNSGSKLFSHWEGANIVIFLPEKLQTRDRVRDCLAQLYLKEAKQWFPHRVDKLNRLHFQHRINRVSVKGQLRILGSCSSKGNLNFNWRLLLAPVEIVDYVIIHELAHMLEMNHSQRFWQIVEGACPGYRQHLSWLRDMAGTLYI